METPGDQQKFVSGLKTNRISDVTGRIPELRSFDVTGRNRRTTEVLAVTGIEYSEYDKNTIVSIINKLLFFQSRKKN